MINVLITSFGGLGLPNVLSMPLLSSTLIDELETQLSGLLPHVRSRFILTTNSGKGLSSHSSEPISFLLSDIHDTFLPLRLSTELCGGKGGFGSQLRAAGGRMSSRRKKNQGDSNSSNRNLDGRRLRTVAEAKALAEYLALKPDMEKKEKEARRNRWEKVVELAEKKEAEARIDSKGRVDVQWVADKEEAEEKTREAVLTALMSGKCHDKLTVNLTGASHSGCDRVFVDMEDLTVQGATEEAKRGRPEPTTRTFYGFDDDDGSSENGEEGRVDQEK